LLLDGAHDDGQGGSECSAADAPAKSGASNDDPLVRPEAIILGVVQLLRYVKDEMANDYPEVLEIYKTLVAHNKDVQTGAEVKREEFKKAFGVAEMKDADEKLRRLYYHGVVKCKPNVDFAKQFSVVGLFGDAMEQKGEGV